MLGLWGIGDAIVLYLAGLLNVPRELYEAITVEGANAWQRFRHVTLPMITPVILFTVITGMIDSFQYFDQAFVASTTAGSGPGDPQGSLMFYGVWRELLPDFRHTASAGRPSPLEPSRRLRSTPTRFNRRLSETPENL